MGKETWRAEGELSTPVHSSVDSALPLYEHAPEAEQDPPSQNPPVVFIWHTVPTRLTPASPSQLVKGHLRMIRSPRLIAFTNHTQIKRIKIASRVGVSSPLDAGSSECGALIGFLMQSQIIALIK